MRPSALCENATLRDRRGRCAKPEGFFAMTSAGIGVVEVQRLRAVFVRFWRPARPSAGIGVVEVQNLRFFSLRFLRDARDPLRGSAWSRCKNFFFLRLLPCDPLRGLCVSDRSCYGPVQILAVRARPCAEIVRFQIALAVNLRISLRSAHDRLQGSGCKIATFKYKSTTQSMSL